MLVEFQSHKSNLFVLLLIFLNQFSQIHAPVFLKEGDSVKIMKDQELAKKLFQTHVGEWSADAAAVSILHLKVKCLFFLCETQAILYVNCIEKKPRWQAVRRIFLGREMLAAKDE